VDRGCFRSNEPATFGTAARGGASATAFEGGLGSAVNFPWSLTFSLVKERLGKALRAELRKALFWVFRMSIAKILEDRKTDNMAEVVHEGGVWRDGAFLFPDGSGGSFSRNESYRDSKGVLRFHIVFVSNSVTG
jgi:hypothetical protein